MENGFWKIGIKGVTGSSSEIENKGGSAFKGNKREIGFGNTAADIGPKGIREIYLPVVWVFLGKFKMKPIQPPFFGW